jgi:hypothetical protein
MGQQPSTTPLGDVELFFMTLADWWSMRQMPR